MHVNFRKLDDRPVSTVYENNCSLQDIFEESPLKLHSIGVGTIFGRFSYVWIGWSQSIQNRRSKVDSTRDRF